MFEVGKLYKGKYHNLIVKCVWTNGVYATLEYETSKECFCSDHKEGWTEYTPPVIHTRYVHWYRNKHESEAYVFVSNSEKFPYDVYVNIVNIKTEKITCEEK